MSSINFESSLPNVNAPSTINLEDKKSAEELDQSDFIELLVAQVKNQDPTKPMDPSQFMNQLTQSSMVNGINELQKSFDTLASKLSSDQSLQAANLVGKSVLTKGGQGTLQTAGSISGQVTLDQQASDVNITIFNTSGEQIKSLSLGGSNKGDLQFKWDGFADDGSVAKPGKYLVTAEAFIDGAQQALEVSLESRIDSININKNSDGVQTGTLLNLASGSTVSLSDVSKIK